MNRKSDKTKSKCLQLRELLNSDQLEFILEAHNGLSARIVEEAGFAGIWGSGLAISAQFGVRDSNEASWTQVTEILEFMSDVTTIPILLDGDTGYGNFNNMRRLVHKLEQRDIAGVCIEDKHFPKTNSFIDGERQPLADIDEFCGKIKAGKDSQSDDDFCIVARVEALIAGWDMSEALKRAEAYRLAGADAILIHSKLSQADEVLEFAREWDSRSPLVIVPTKYYSTPTEVFRKAGIDLVIWANHMIRAAAINMENVSRQIFEQESLANVEDQVASVNHIFELQGAEELSLASSRYLKRREENHAIVLAASRGNGLDEVTEDRPKVMIPIGGKTLLRRLVDKFKKQSISNITVVGGYKAEAIDMPGIKLRINEAFETTSELASLACARDDFNDNMLIIYGDVLFRSYILSDLLDSRADMVIVVDSMPASSRMSGAPDYTYCNLEDDRSLFKQKVLVTHMSEQPDAGRGEPSGRWTGMLKVNEKGRQWLEQALDELQQKDDFLKMTMPDLVNYLVEQEREVHVHYINGHWLDVNSLDDIGRASDFTHGQ